MHTPVLLVCGEQDPVAPFWGQQLVESVPNAHLVVLPDAGQLPWLDAPERLAALVRDSLSSSPCSDNPARAILA